MPNPCIGILAGMGPRSTAPFLEAVYDQCQIQYGATYDIDFPHMLIYSLPTPFYLDRPLDHRAMQDTISGGLRKLAAAGAAFIAMPCNSAHLYYDALAAAIDVPLLHIGAATMRQLSAAPGPGTGPVPGGAHAARPTVTVLATEITFDSGIYQQGIAAAGYEFVFAPEWQTMVNQLIQMVKTQESPERLDRLWRELLAALRNHGVTRVIIACTDLAKLKAPADPAAGAGASLRIIDSTLALAQTTVHEYLQRR